MTDVAPPAKRRLAQYPRVVIRSRAAWRRWLTQHHAGSGPIWLVTYKRSTGSSYVPYGDVVDEALCFGWVDSLPRTLDDERTMRLLSPRKPGSPWSQINKRRVAALIAQGRMTPAGLAVVDAAKRDGSWSSYDAVESLSVPDDLAAALRRSPQARGYFEAFPPSTKKAIFWWIASAKTDATRAKRVAETVRLATRNIRANQYRQPKGASAARGGRGAAHEGSRSRGGA